MVRLTRETAVIWTLLSLEQSVSVRCRPDYECGCLERASLLGSCWSQEIEICPSEYKRKSQRRTPPLSSFQLLVRSIFSFLSFRFQCNFGYFPTCVDITALSVDKKCRTHSCLRGWRCEKNTRSISTSPGASWQTWTRSDDYTIKLQICIHSSEELCALALTANFMASGV